MTRPAHAEDAVRLAEIHVSGWRHAYRGIVPDQELFVTRTVSKSLVFWERLLAENPASVVVFDDGVVKGFCIHGPCRDVDAFVDWEIQAIYVQPEFLGQGVGTALLVPVEQAAKT